MKLLLFILNLIGLIAAIIWFISKPSWEAGSSSAILLSALISQFFWNDNVTRKKEPKYISKNIEKKRIAKMKQPHKTIPHNINLAEI